MLTRREFLRSLTATSICISALKAAKPGLDYLSNIKAHYDFVDGKPEVIKNSWSIAVLPDTQYYSIEHKKYFLDQTNWLAKNYQKFNIKFVAHVGDVTDENSVEEWKFAQKAFAPLDKVNLPYGFCIGNHDMSDGGWCFDRSTLANVFFPLEHWKTISTFKGGMVKRQIADNSFHLLNAEGQKYLIMFLEFGPRDKVLRWASKIVRKYNKRKVIIVTHTYLNNDNNRINKSINNHLYTPQNYAVGNANEGVNDGQQMWEKFISQHKNIQLVLCGHIDPFAYLKSKGNAKNIVHQMMVDYQDWDKGGEGFMRLLQFSNKGDKLCVQDFSPSTNQINKYKGARYTICL